MDAATAAAINQQLNQAGNYLATSNVNKMTRKWNEKMYAMQRQHNLADWEMQNAYNSPAAQMQRLKDAGLNPNLVYGNGATTEAGNVKGADVKSWSPTAPEFPVNNPIGTMYDIQLKQAQLNNLETINTVNEETAKLRAAQALAAITGGKRSELSYSKELELYGTSIDAAKANLNNLLQKTENLKTQKQKLETDIMYTIDENTRKWQLQKPRLNQAAAETLLTIARKNNVNASSEQIYKAIQIAEQELRIKSKHAELWEAGQNPNDPMWQRMLIDLINNGLKKIAGFSLKDLMK